MTASPSHREAIHDVLASYCRGIDRRDPALVRACFHPDSTDDHGRGPRPLDEFLDWCFALLDGYDSTFHLLGQSRYTFVSDTEADVETYGIASHRTAGGPDHRNLVTGFRYLDRFSARNDSWRIATRRAVTDWSRVDHEAAWWPVPAELLQGQAGPHDPSYDNLNH